MKMYLISLVSLVVLTGCLKDDSCQPKTVQSETATMLNYANANGITPTTHSSGMLYQIVSAGAGATPTATSTVTVRYTGKLMNGTIFDSNATGSPISFGLNQVIKGWQLGLPLIKKDGVIKLIIPSSLAYGCTGYGSIPGDAVLYFEIQLIDVQ
jgi:FKBP-type peptidyl-prolyl cis-trans isomerase FkpA